MLSRRNSDQFPGIRTLGPTFKRTPWPRSSRVCPLIDIGQYVSQTMSSRYTFRSSTWRCFKNNLWVNCSKVPVPRASNWWISWPPSWTTQSCCCCWVFVSVAPCDTASASLSMQWMMSDFVEWYIFSFPFASEGGNEWASSAKNISRSQLSPRRSVVAMYSWPKSEILAFSRGTFGCCALRRFVILKSWNTLFLIGESSGVFLVTITSLTNWSYWSLPLS